MADSIKNKASLKEFTLFVRKIEQQVPCVNASLNNVGDKLQTVHMVVSKIEETSKHLNTCISAVKNLSKGATFLSMVPLVGGFIGALSKVLKTVEGSLNAVQNALNDIKKAAKELEKTVNVANNGVQSTIDFNNKLVVCLPKFVKTIKVLDYMLQIADCVVPVAMGTSLSGKLEEIRNKIEKIENSAIQPIDDMRKSFDELNSVLESIKQECVEIEAKTADIKTVIDSIKKISDILSPIGNAFQKIINAITPIKWVLKAAECLINKVLKPVIDAILKATGLQRLIDGIETKIIACLGFDQIIDNIKEIFCKAQFIKELQKMASFNDDLQKTFGVLSNNLQEFSPMGNVDLGNSIKKMLGELFETQIDPTRPAYIPDWPEEEVIMQVNYNHKKRTKRFDWNWYLVQEPMKDDMPKLCNNNIVICELHDSLCKEIARKAETIIQQMQDVEDKRIALNANIMTLEASLRLPDYFNLEIKSFQEYLRFISKSILFIANLSTTQSLKEKLSDISRWVEGQIKDCDSLISGITKLRTALTDNHCYSESILFAIHTEDVQNMGYTVNSYAESLQVMLDSFDLSAEHNPDAESIQKLNEVKIRIRENGNGLLQTLSEIEKSMEVVLQKYQLSCDKLDATLLKYKELSPEGYILSENTVRIINAVAEKLSQIEGVLDPLELLIEVLREKNDLMVNGFDVVSVAKNTLRNFSVQTVKSIEKTDTWELLNQLSPITYLKENIQDFVNNSLLLDKEVLDDLLQQVQNTVSQISKGYEYKYDEEIISNKLINDEDIKNIIETSNHIVEH